MYLSDAYTVGFSLGQLPTLTVPQGTATGLQITAAKNNDELVLKFANFFGIQRRICLNSVDQFRRIFKERNHQGKIYDLPKAKIKFY